MTFGPTQLIVRAMRKAPEIDTVWVSIPLDAETAERLRILADDCHVADVSTLAASLLHDVLKDDEDAHAEQPGDHHHHYH